ncbi:UDP-3-O-(3-hydroxymyristoyl)glucosamine N-acyltransferase [Leptolyngbya sp. PCC 6406]|uniref:UDP-3-O-(3-hydroxymyristoyl)glucosamine N-acyltransferase n=1 Tax=Leptolyngbya sp. PCC 6406 TaxID=1173264 RepID=UPI0002ACA2A3|nr:UDP-3-O-(3-hydroxymyristoyl)glucosamine N-acyltransferase [Leptolyngbya sp. PCC 6406]
MKFSELVQRLAGEIGSYEVSVATDPDLTGLSAIEETLPQTLSYIEGERYGHHIATTAASALILPLNAKLQTQACDRGLAWMAVKEPRVVLAWAINCFYCPCQPEAGIAPTATIHPTAHLAPDVAVGPNVVVGPGVKVGAGVCIYPNVVIYPGATIGDRTVLHANCVIHERSEIGPDCIIHSGAVIGSEGFGFVPIPDGWLKMPQSGRVVLAAGVEIGCNTAVDRPALGTTQIGRNTKIDNLVQIAHGSKIGENCAIAAQVGMAGGVKIGHRVILAGQVGIVDHVEIGDGAIATAKAGVHSSVSPGAIVTGIPAIPHKLFLKATAIYNRLPDMYQGLRKLQKAAGTRQDIDK